METLVNLSYIAAAILFIFGIKMLGDARTAKRGNLTSALGMLIAVVITLCERDLDYRLIFGGLALGSAIGFVAAKRVQMTGMPELVALFNGFGGLGSLLVGWAEYHRVAHSANLFTPEVSRFTAAVIVLAILIGGVTFTLV